MAPVHGQEITRRDSIGSYDAYRELQDISSVQLMRDSILRTISKDDTRVNNNQRRCGIREEIPSPSHPSIEVKFMEKRCSSFNSPTSQSSEETNKEVRALDQIYKRESPRNFDPLPLPDFEVSGSFEASGELLKETTKKEAEVLKNTNEDADDDHKLKISGRNNLKLAIRSSSGGIFEDCSTYNICCPETSPEIKSNEIFTNSTADSFSDVASDDLETSSEGNYSYSGSELNFSNSINKPDSPDEQTSLCDTFFTHFINNDSGQLANRQSPRLTEINRKTSTSERQPIRNCQIPNEKVADKTEDVADVTGFHGGRRNSKKMRRRSRKSHSKDPFVYECPKCGVSYVIASKMANDGVCLHCDLWTSVEPEFVKREKLLTWNTCRIC